MSKDKVIYFRCPYCGTLMRDDSVDDEFNYKNAFWGSVFFGTTIGLLAGLAGRRRVKYHCLKCGKKFSVKV